jgi:hypothetical protein
MQEKQSGLNKRSPPASLYEALFCNEATYVYMVCMSKGAEEKDTEVENGPFFFFLCVFYYPVTACSHPILDGDLRSKCPILSVVGSSVLNNFSLFGFVLMFAQLMPLACIQQ